MTHNGIVNVTKLLREASDLQEIFGDLGRSINSDLENNNVTFKTKKNIVMIYEGTKMVSPLLDEAASLLDGRTEELDKEDCESYLMASALLVNMKETLVTWSAFLQVVSLRVIQFEVGEEDTGEDECSEE